MEIVASESVDLDVRGICRANRGRPVVGLQHVVAQVLIRPAEDSPLTRAVLTADLAREGSIEDIDVQLAPAIHLKDAARGAAAEQRQIQLRSQLHAAEL